MQTHPDRTSSDQTRLRIAFAGTPDFSVPALQAMINKGYMPVLVLTQPDRRAGRGRTLQPGPVKKCAINHNIPVLQPEKLSGAGIQSELQAMNLDLMVVVAYGLILPLKILQIPSHGCWNIHGSLLPRWRGAAPVQRAIEAGDKTTGISMMQMDAGLDTGAVLSLTTTDIAEDETGGSLHDRLAELGAKALVESLDKLANNALPQAVKQDEGLVTYASKLDKAEARIDWLLSAVNLERKIRAYNPWPVCWFELDGKRIRVWNAEAIGTQCRHDRGEILAANAHGIDIATADGILRLTEIQSAGGKRMSVADYLNAHAVRAAK